MSKSNDIFENTTCSSSEEVVAYLYEELDAARAEAFETHLAACDSCTAELADVSFARLDVYEWNRDEFARMPTPPIRIPYGDPVRSSFFDGVRAFFAQPVQWAMAGAAFAVIAVALGGWYLMPSQQELAVSNVNKKESTEAPNKGLEQPKVATRLAALPEVELNSAKDSESAPAAADKDIRPVNASATRGSRPVNPRTIRTPRRAATPAAQARRQNAPRLPRLNDFEDEDDNTLRLGDLLAEIDTRDE